MIFLTPRFCASASDSLRALCVRIGSQRPLRNKGEADSRAEPVATGAEDKKGKVSQTSGLEQSDIMERRIAANTPKSFGRLCIQFSAYSAPGAVFLAVIYSGFRKLLPFAPSATFAVNA